MSIIENAKEIADLIKKAGNVDLYRKIVDLEAEIVDLIRMKNTQESAIEDLKKKLGAKDSLRFKEPFYYMDGDEVPFCPKCWESKQKTIHLIRTHISNDRGTRYDCPECSLSEMPKGMPGTDVSQIFRRPPRP
jgi:hypothetical protein